MYNNSKTHVIFNYSFNDYTKIANIVSALANRLSTYNVYNQVIDYYMFLLILISNKKIAKEISILNSKRFL